MLLLVKSLGLKKKSIKNIKGSVRRERKKLERYYKCKKPQLNLEGAFIIYFTLIVFPAYIIYLESKWFHALICTIEDPYFFANLETASPGTTL